MGFAGRVVDVCERNPKRRVFRHRPDHLLIHPDSLLVLTDTKTDRRVERLHLLGRIIETLVHRLRARVRLMEALASE